jgi:hypothetical protein
MAKKSSKIKKKTSKATPVLSRVKKIAKGIVTAMGTKSKKAQTKAPAKAPVKSQKSAKPVAPKSLKMDKKEAKIEKHAKPVAKPGKPAKVEAPVQHAKGKTPAKAPVTAPSVAVAAPVKAVKAAKGKPSKAAAAQALHNERMCRESGCENQATTKGYCRLDYIKNWKKIKRKEMILKEGKLNQYIEELVSKYPDKYIEVIRQDLSTEVNFTKVIHDLELDETMDDLEYDGDSIDSLIGSIRKEDEGFDDSEF